jgi:hypothetical protein
MRRRRCLVTDPRWKVIFEVGALLGTTDPAKFADFILAPPCQHYGDWDHDDEACPAPCGLTHDWCRACGRPMKPPCPILEELEATP